MATNSTPQSNGYQVSDCGRLSAEIMHAWADAVSQP